LSRINSDLKSQKEGLLYLNPKEVKFLLDRILSRRNKLLVGLLYELSCSLKELVNIRVRDINLENKTIFLKQGHNSSRSVRESIISDYLSELIHDYLKNKNLLNKKIAFLFFSSHGGHMTIRRATQIITLLLKNNGFENRVNPQVLKYSHIVNAYYGGVPVSCIAMQTGLTKQRLISILLDLDDKQINSGYHTFFNEV
jgi:integrase/recombinase XerD